MSGRSRSLADVLPIAALEPDGLMITSDLSYVRLLACRGVLKPRAGGSVHRELLRERLGALAAHLPAGQGLQVLVEAEPLDPSRALESDWEQIQTASLAADETGEAARGEAMRQRPSESRRSRR